MSTSPNTQASQDPGLAWGKSSRQQQILEKTHLPIGSISASQTEPKYLGSDTQPSHQTEEYSECSTQRERYGTNPGWTCGILQQELWKAPSQEAQEYVEMRPESGNEGQQTPAVKNSLQPQKVFLGGLSLHLNHLIASHMGICYGQFGTLPIGIFLSNLDSRQLDTSVMTSYGHF